MATVYSLFDLDDTYSPIKLDSLNTEGPDQLFDCFEAGQGQSKPRQTHSITDTLLLACTSLGVYLMGSFASY